LEQSRSVMMGNLYSSHYPRYSERAAKDGMLGGEVSFWTKTNEQCVAREGKFFDLMYTAEMLWCADYCEQARIAYSAWIAERLPTVRAWLRGEAALKVKKPLNFQKDKKEFFCKSINGALLRDPLSLAVNETADELRFTHTTLHREKRIAWDALLQIGTYTITYTDGTKVKIPVTYDGNVRCFKYRFAEPLHEPYYRHEGYVCAWDSDPVDGGYTPDGTPITLYALNWHNPHPDKKIRSVVCREYADSAAGLLLCDISLLKG
jgi:hypothetical protein